MFAGFLMIFILGCGGSRTMTKEEKIKAKHREFCKFDAGIDGMVDDSPSGYAKLAAYNKCMKLRTGDID